MSEPALADRLVALREAVRVRLARHDALSLYLLDTPAVSARPTALTPPKPEQRVLLVPGYRITPKTGLRDCLRTGWSLVEDWGVWSDGPVAIAVFKVPEWLDLPFKLKLRISGFMVDKSTQKIDISAGNATTETVIFLSRDWRDIDIIVDRDHLSGDNCLDLGFFIHTPYCPADLYESTDRRQLGVALYSIYIG